MLNQCDTSQWKLAENVSCTKLLVRNDIYDLFMENRSTPEETIDYRWEDSCIKATLLLHARTEEEIEKINRRYELCTPLFEKDDLVEFYFDNGTKKQNAKELLQEQIFIGYMGILKQLNMTFGGRIMKTIEKSVYISILMRII